MESLTRRGVLVLQAKIGEGRGVGEALKNGVKIASVAEVFKP